MVDALEAYLFPGTVAENICFGPRQRAEGLLVEVSERLLEGVGLVGYVRRGVSNLSGGKAQRVSLVRTLANPSEVLLLQNPRQLWTKLPSVAMRICFFESFISTAWPSSW